MMNTSSQTLQDAIKTHTDWVAATADQFRILLPLLRLLAEEGQPVEPERLATVSHHSLDEVEALVQSSDIEVDQTGKIVGWGLTLVPTPHQFHLGEKTFYGWCALDTLIFPALLQATGKVVSTCPATGKQVRLTETPQAIVNLEPTSAVISARSPGEAANPCNVREGFCLQGHFFASRDVAASWPSLHPGAVLFSIEEAAQLAREMARRILALEQEPGGRPLSGFTQKSRGTCCG
jgi:alkylmercury lyase